jgi:hypothetical protein
MTITLRETKIGLKAFSKCLNSIHQNKFGKQRLNYDWVLNVIIHFRLQIALVILDTSH